MTTRVGALGRLFDIGVIATPVDMDDAAVTGKRISMQGCDGITFVYFCGAGTGGSDIGVDLQQHTAYTGGTPLDLDIITEYYTKQELILDNDESWVLATQAAASEITEVGGLATSGELMNLLVVEVTADQLADGYTHLSMDFTDPGAAKLGCCLAIKWGLHSQRTPANLPNLLNPGAANV